MKHPTIRLGSNRRAMAAFVRECGGTVSELLEVHEFPDTGRGLRATGPIAKGALLVEAPHDALISIDNVLASLGTAELRAALGEARGKLPDTDVVAVFLMWARCESNHASLAPSLVSYLRALPAVQAGPSPLNQSMFWTEDELRLLSGTDAFQVALQLKAQVREDFGTVVSELFLQHPALFPLRVDSDASGGSEPERAFSFTYREYKWALGILWSRGMDFMQRGGPSLRAIVPFADYLNTDFEGDVTHAYLIDKRCVHVRAKRAFAAGEQVFINYTPTSSSRLLQLYGFACRPPAMAAHEAIQLWAAMNASDPRFGEVQALLAKLLPGVDPNAQPFLLTEADPLPASLVLALHVQRGLWTGKDDCNMDAGVVEELHGALLARKASYHGDKRADVQLLVRASASPGIPEREKLALYIRLGEGRILDKTLRSVEGIAKSLESALASAPPAAAAAAAKAPEAHGLDDMD